MKQRIQKSENECGQCFQSDSRYIGKDSSKQDSKRDRRHSTSRNEDLGSLVVEVGRNNASNRNTLHRRHHHRITTVRIATLSFSGEGGKLTLGGEQRQFG